MIDDQFSQITFVDLPPNRVAFRDLGEGEPLLLVHGYPLSGLTWRHVAPALADTYRCIVPDLLGAGETEWSDETDFGFAAQAQMLKDLADSLGLTSYRVLAHDTGGTIARQLALIDIDRVRSMVLIGTEIPNHRPPWIPFLQRVGNPKTTALFKMMMRSRRMVRSRIVFGGCFWDPELIFGEFYETHVTPVLRDNRRIRGSTQFLIGIDWDLLDGLATHHKDITAPTLLLWGEDDTVFPVQEARPMVEQLGDCRGFVTIPHARLFVHEEHPDDVVRIARDFFVHDDRKKPIGA
jgi:pimeloyl-ACP methyl ester carboxylesterase